MKISISTIKENKVYGILYAEKPCKTNVSKQEFESRVTVWAHAYFKDVLSIFTAVEPNLYSMCVILDINNQHDKMQNEMDI